MPKSTTAKTMAVKGRQVRRYYALLCRLGLDRLYDQAGKAAVAAPRTPGPSKASKALEVAKAPDEGAATLTLDLDFGEILRALADDASALDELSAAVLDLDDEAAAEGEWLMSELAEAWVPFREASAAPMRMLLGSVV